MQQPLVWLVDDEQWLDRASAQILGFVAQRFVAESVGLVLAARVPSSDLAGVSELTVEGLREADARALGRRAYHLAVLHVRCGGVRPSIGLTDHRAILYALLLLSCASDRTNFETPLGGVGP